MKVKKIVMLGFLMSLLFLAIIFIVDKTVSYQTKEYIFDDVQSIPKNKVGLILGTSKKLANGHNNLYFTYRIQAAKELYESGKVAVFVVSGDNSRKEYNEAEDMKNDLVLAGIPEDYIYLDYAGFRTLDSVIRIKEIFGQSKFTIISQKFHNERAVLIARHYGLDAVGYNAKDVSSHYGFKTMLREKFARVKMYIDFLTAKQPKYLGEKVEIK